MGKYSTGVRAFSVLSFVRGNCVNQGDRLTIPITHIHIEQPAFQLLENVGSGPIRRMDNELVSVAAIIHDAIPTLAHARERQDVGNTLGVIPHGPISRKIAYQVGGGDSGVAVNIQIFVALAHIGE
jgi:hypothetical protein